MKQKKKVSKTKTPKRNSSFWYKTNKSKSYLLGLAPMAGVSDEPFRLIVAKYGKPDFIYTEFIWPEALLSMSEEALKNIIYSEKERPIIAQIVGNNPEAFYKIAPILCELGFDGIDINMGCPDKHILARGAGAALIKNPSLAKKLFEVTQKSVNDWTQGKDLKDYGYTLKEINFWKTFRKKYHLKLSKNRKHIPISLKTRIGYKEPDIKWLRFVITKIHPEVFILHMRTFKENRKGLGQWDIMEKLVPLATKNKVIIIGNGGINSHAEALDKIKKYNLKGIMIAQGALGNPWIFNDKQPTTKERLKIALEHAKLYKSLFGDKKFFTMRKHLLWYTNGLINSKELRRQLCQVSTYAECQAIISNYLREVKH